MYPLSLIASLMSHPDTECAHVIKYLRNVDIRMKTYPKEWLERCSGDDTTLANPESLAEAGFYCNAWLHSSAWIKCFACPAHAGLHTISVTRLDIF